MSDSLYIQSHNALPNAMKKAAKRTGDVEHWEHDSASGHWVVIGNGSVTIGVNEQIKSRYRQEREQ